MLHLHTYIYIERERRAEHPNLSRLSSIILLSVVILVVVIPTVMAPCLYFTISQYEDKHFASYCLLAFQFELQNTQKNEEKRNSLSKAAAFCLFVQCPLNVITLSREVLLRGKAQYD
jgi:hypothetical protein